MTDIAAFGSSSANFCCACWNSCIGGSVACQRPSLPAAAEALFPAKETVTSSPGRADHHTGTGRPRWRTMPSANGEASSSAHAHTIMNAIVFSFAQMNPRLNGNFYIPICIERLRQ